MRARLPPPSGAPSLGISPRRLLLTLSITVSVAYGALFYGFSVLLSDAAAGADFTSTVLSTAFGGAVITGGATSVVVGRVADRWGIRSILGLGAVVGGAGMLLFSMATAPSQVILVWWLLLGPAMAMTFYEPAYVAIDQWFPAIDRVRAIASLTLLAGLSGPVFIPLTGVLVDTFGWRSATVLLGAGLAVACGAAALLVVPSGVGRRPRPADVVSLPLRAMVGDPRLLVFTTAAFLAYGAMEGTVVHRVARFEDAGFALSTVTAWAAVAGVLSLPARFLLPSLASRVAPTLVFAGVLTALTVAVGFAVVGSTYVELVIHFALFGMVFGAALPLRAVVMGDWYSGPTFGRAMGVQAAVLALGRAGAPVLVGVLRDVTSSYQLPMAALALALGASAVLTMVAGRIRGSACKGPSTSRTSPDIQVVEHSKEHA